MHLLFKAEHTFMVSHRFITVLLIRSFCFGMMAVKEFDNVESAFVDVEVNIPGLKVRCAGFPDERFRIQPFDFLPCRIADALAVSFGVYKQQFQFIVLCFFIDLQHKASNDPVVFTNTVSHTTVDLILNNIIE